MVMPYFQSVPSIRIDLLDGSPRSLSSSSTLDIRDILSQVKLWPDLLTEDFVFDDVDDALYLEDGPLQDIPSFPVDHRPPLFILQAHRARLPFPIRQEAFELGDFCIDEDDACPLLTAPTVPRMKLMIKEQLYVQKWADTLTSDNPPKHIPWSCEKPATERKWIAEGSIFPSHMVKRCTEQGAADQQPPGVPCTNRCLALADRVSHSSKLCPFSEASAPIRALSEPATSRSRVPIKSTGVDRRMLRGESKSSRPQTISKVSQAPPTLPPSGLPTVTKSNAPLAARRGKSPGGLILKGSVIEQLEYPDIPTAFRGSPSVWSPQFDALPTPSFTDHQSMLLDLKLKGAALRSAVSTYNPENSCPYPEVTRDKWVFTRGPTTFDDISGPVDDEVPKEIVAGPGMFLPDDSSTPARGLGPTARHGFVSCPDSTPALQSPIKRSSDPPETPLPPRPALINPSTPPHVRGILKKVKSVRFEDMIIKESHETSPIIRLPQPSPERPSPQRSAASTRRPCTPVPITTRSRYPIKEIPVRSAEETKPAPRPRPTPKRTKANRKLELMHHNAGNPLETSKSVMATSSIARPCRIAHVKRNTSPEGLSITETDVRRGIEGTAKSRLSAPLRNIFRFR